MARSASANFPFAQFAAVFLCSLQCGCAAFLADDASGPHLEASNSQASPPLGPYSSAVCAGDLLFVSGVLGFDHGANRFAAPDISAQTEQAFNNLESVLSAADASLGDIVKISVYLRSPADAKEMNAVYEKRLGKLRPARTFIAGADWGRDDILIEIEAVALCRR